jgi:uncharacterized protein (TIGR02147 family)
LLQQAQGASSISGKVQLQPHGPELNIVFTAKVEFRQIRRNCPIKVMLSKMVSIFEYLNYRVFLMDAYKERKGANPAFSYRYIGSKVGLNASTFVRILQGKRNVTRKHIPSIAAVFHLKKQEEKYFELLVQFNQAAGTEDKKIYFEKLLSFKNTRFSLLLKDKYDLFNEWYYIAIRELLGHYSFKDDFEALARMVTPPILPREARNAIALLEKMKLIARDSRGFYKPTDALVTVGEDWQSIAIANFQKSTIQLAESAIDRFKPDERDISTLTVNMSQKKLNIVKEKIRLLRKEIMEIENMDRDNDTVFQINFQIFPMSRSSRVP